MLIKHWIINALCVYVHNNCAFFLVGNIYRLNNRDKLRIYVIFTSWNYRAFRWCNRMISTDPIGIAQIGQRNTVIVHNYSISRLWIYVNRIDVSIDNRQGFSKSWDCFKWIGADIVYCIQLCTFITCERTA